MSELRIESWTMPVAALGPENPLPSFSSPWQMLHEVEATPGVPGEIALQSQYGRPPGILPYTMQDGYDRQRRPRAVPVAVLENEILRATFLLPYGARLWSLYHKESERELLAVNRVIQPANLALRNAWFSGGVEWNVGTIGHSPFTMSPLFAARVLADDGTPLLRFYEWERLRQMPFQIDAYLPERSPVLFIRVRLLNPHHEPLPVYWWSNMAVVEAPDVRVVVPADAAFRFTYARDSLRRNLAPVYEDVDYSYPTRVAHASDYFFDLPRHQRRWIAALDEEGEGLVQTSTARLGGRKLFVWGSGRGGKQWQWFLAPEGAVGEHYNYIEIQAGLARTQLEHVPLPAHSEWSWLEAYGMLSADPAQVHGVDWAAAQATVAAALEGLIPEKMLQEADAWGAALADRPPQTLLQRGSGWGALARHERVARGEPETLAPGMPFDDASLAPAQDPWLQLLEQGTFPEAPTTDPPANLLVTPRWRRRLEGAIAAGQANNWAAWYHLGVMRYYDGEAEGARLAWQRSLAQAVTPWALRNLALLAGQAGETDRAETHYRQALRLAPALRPLAVEAGRFLVASGRSQAWLDLLPELAPALRKVGRVRLLEAEAALACGELELVAEFFADAPAVADLREGELSLGELWFEWQARKLVEQEGLSLESARSRARRECPLPPAFDFNMFRADVG